MLDSFFTLFQTDALSFVLSIALSIITTTFVLHRCTDPRSSSPAAALAHVTSSPTKKDIPPPAREMREMAIQAGDGDMTTEDLLRTQLEEEKKNHDLDKEAAMSREEILRAHLELEKMFHEEVAIERQETLAREEEYRSALLEAREQTESMVQELVDLTAELEEANRQDAELEAKFRQGAWVHPAVAEKDRLRRELSMATAAAVEGRNKESGYKSKILDLESRLSMASSEIESLRFQLGLQTTHVESLQKHLKSVTAEREVRTPSPPPSALRLPPPTPPMTPSDSQVLTLVKRPTITTLGLSSMHFRSPSWPMPSIPRSPILSPRLSVRPFFVPEGERLDAEDEADGWDCVD